MIELTILQCLEQGTAGQFFDDYAGIAVDLRPIAMILPRTG